MRPIIRRVLRLLRVRETGVAKVQTGLRRLPADQQELRRPLMNGYNFSERVRRALAQAREEAAELHHEYVGPEHCLLGLTRSTDNVGYAMLQQLGVDIAEMRRTIIATVKGGNSRTHGADLPYTSRAKKVLELAMSEASDLRHSHVGTEHLLLGLVREDKGIAAQVLMDCGVSLENARHALFHVLSDPADPKAPKLPPDRTLSERYPKRLADVFAASHEIATRRGNLVVTDAHVAIALLEHGEGLANAAIDRLGFDRAKAIAQLIELVPPSEGTVGPDDVMRSSQHLLATLDAMEEVQRDLRAAMPGTHHLLVAILALSPDIAAVFADQNIDAQRLREEVRRISG